MIQVVKRLGRKHLRKKRLSSETSVYCRCRNTARLLPGRSSQK